jgi:uncharacterized protein
MGASPIARAARRRLAGAAACLALLAAPPAPPAGAGAVDVAGALPDRGIFPELAAGARVTLPPRLGPEALRATWDRGHGLLVLYEGEHPLKAYALAAPAADAAPAAGAPARPRAATLGAMAPALARAGDEARLATLLPRLAPPDAEELRARLPGDLALLDPADPSAPRATDADRDGIPDRLDVLLGARKLVENHATYTEGYFKIAYPGGDVPRDIGVCTDTIVRAFRNAGIDLQRLVAEDVRGARAAYPAIKRPDTNIDHRRVRNLALWFARHARRVPATAPLRPGDVVFFDTFPARSGPDHVGIVSDRMGASGLPLVINNWTVGTVEGEMDLLPWVPVLGRYRLP